MQFGKAQRKKVKIKIGVSAPSGAGKTYSSLLLAYGLTNDWNKIAVIDTENGSASLYDHLGDFNVVNLEGPYTPDRYIEAIDMCILNGVECIVIDSTTHERSGPGGCIEMNENLAKSKYKGNTRSAWNETTPRHDKFIQKILQSDCHFICCTRSKTETIQEGGKIKKVGMKDMQREGREYELTIAFNLDRDTHCTIISKDRTNIFEHRDPFIITAETGKEILARCNAGKELKNTNTIDEIILDLQSCNDNDTLKSIWARCPESFREDIKLEFTATKNRIAMKIAGIE